MRVQATESLLTSLNGSPVYLGTASATTTAASFTTSLLPGMTLMLQAVGDVYVLPGAVGQVIAGHTVPTITSSNGVLLADGEKFMCTLDDPASSAAVQCITASGTASVKVFRLA